MEIAGVDMSYDKIKNHCRVAWKHENYNYFFIENLNRKMRGDIVNVTRATRLLLSFYQKQSIFVVFNNGKLSLKKRELKDSKKNKWLKNWSTTSSFLRKIVWTRLRFWSKRTLWADYKNCHSYK